MVLDYFGDFGFVVEDCWGDMRCGSLEKIK